MSKNGKAADVIRNRIYVGQLSETTKEPDLRKFLRGYGDIKEVMLMRGFAFVEFEEESDAEDAIHELDGKTLNDMKVSVDYAIAPRRTGDRPNYSVRKPDGRRWQENDEDLDDSGDRRPRRNDDRFHGQNARPSGYYGPLVESPWRIVVKNLSEEVSWQDLKDFMRTAGDVTYTSAHDPIPGEGVAEYGSLEALQRAMRELDGKELHGLRVKLVKDEGGGRGRRDGDWRRGSSATASAQEWKRGKEEFRNGAGDDHWRGRGRGRGGGSGGREYWTREADRTRSGRIQPLMGQDRSIEDKYSDEEIALSESEGPGEGCYSVCLSKEIKKLHEEINAIGTSESGCGGVEMPDLKKVEKTTEDNSAKLDELMKAVQNITSGAVSSKDLEQLKSQLADAKSTIDDLKQEKRKLEADIFAKEEEIGEAGNTILILQQLLAKNAKDCRALNDSLNAQISTLEKALTEGVRRIEALEEENKILKAKLEEAKGVVEELKAEVEAANKVVDNSAKRVETLTSELAEEKAKLKKSEDQVGDLTQKLNQEKEKLISNKKVIEKLTKDIEEEKRVVQASKTKIDQLTADLMDEKKKLEQAKNNAMIAEERLKEATAEAEKCEEEAEKLKTALEAEEKAAAKCGNDLSEANQRLKESEEAAKELEGQLRTCKEDGEKKERETKEQIEKMKKDLDQLMKEKADLTKEAETCKTTQTALERKVAELEQTIEGNKAKIADLTKKNADLKAEKNKTTAENAVLKKDLEEALKNGGSSEETNKLKEENEKLKKENEAATNKIQDLEKEIATITTGKKSKKLDFTGAIFGATSEAPFSEAEKAFNDNHFSSWTSSGDAPQTIWVQLKQAERLTRLSFKCAMVPENGASKFEVVAANDAKCSQDSAWDVIHQDLSGNGFVTDADTMEAEVDACKMYNCYGIRVLDVNNTGAGNKWVVMSEVKMWARA